MFRYERPQKGRMRQFHQINCECLGPVEPQLDAEVIIMLMDFLTKLGIKDLSVEVNSLGDSNCRPIYREKLQSFLNALPREELCADCQRRMDTNPMRLLDCKVPTCQALVKDAPVMTEHICEPCREHFKIVTSLLDKSGLAWNLNSKMVRGLDYYNRTTFEIVSNSIGAQGSVAGGGRYDGLIRELGGPDVAGIGFACGMERLAMLLPETTVARPDFYIAVVEDIAMDEAFKIAQKLRQAGLKGEMSFTAKGLKGQMKTAGRLNVRKSLVLGGSELEKGTIQVKDMDLGEQAEVAVSDLLNVF